MSFREATGFNSKGEKDIEEWKKTLPKFRVLKYDQHGEGFLSNAYNYVKKKVKDVVQRVKDVSKGLRLDYPPAARKLIEKHKDEKIVEIVVCRLPIKSYLNTILNWVSAGRFEQNIKSLNYDSAFHLFAKMKTDKGTSLLFEKNQVIKIQSEGVEQWRLLSFRHTEDLDSDTKICNRW